MTHHAATTHRRRAVFLWYLLIALSLAALLVLLLGRMIVSAIYLQRMAAQHANRVQVQDALVRQLRLDLVAAVGYDWREPMLWAGFYDYDLELRTSTRSGPASIRYVFRPEAVWRYAADGGTTCWQAWRLRFEAGSAEGLLYVDFIEEPPPQRSAVLRRDFATVFRLPPPVELDRSETEEFPPAVPGEPDAAPAEAQP